MPIDKSSAEEIASLFSKVSATCDESLRVVKTEECLGHVQVYGRLVGQFLGHSYTNVLAPIWSSFPELEPPSMKEPYVEPEARLTPESELALRTFVTEAQSALERTKALLSAEEAAKVFAFGGLEEVEQAVSDIAAFLEKPRLRDNDSPT